MRLNGYPPEGIPSLSFIGTSAGSIVGSGTLGPQGIQGPQGSGVGIDVTNSVYGADPTGVADSTAAFTNAIAALPSTGGWVYAPSGVYKISSTLSLHQFQGLRGDGKLRTTLEYTGTGPCILAANTAGGVTQEDSPVGLDGFSIDGSGAGTGAIGLNIGNLYASTARDLYIRHFNTTGGMGVYLYNGGAGVAACERSRFSGISLWDCSTAVVFDTGSFDYGDYDFTIESAANQCGVTLQNAAILARGRMQIRGNFATGTTNTGWVLAIDPGNTTGTSSIVDADWDLGVECDYAGTGKNTGHYSVVMGSTNIQSRCTGSGVMAFQNGPTNANFQGASLATSGSASGRFGFSGSLSDTVLGSMVAGDGLAVQGGSQWNVYGSNTKAAFPGGTSIFPQWADIQEFLLASGTNTVASFNGAPYLRARKMEILLHQPASGAAGTVTWPSNVIWSGAGGGALSTTNGAVDKVRLTYYPSQGNWYGEVVQNTFPTLNQSTTGTAAGITGKTTPVGAIVGTSDTQALTNKDLTGSGNTFPTLNQNTTGTAASLSSTLPVSTGGTGVATLTGLVKAAGTAAFAAAVAGTDYLAPAAIGATVQAYAAALTSWAAKTVPAGTIADLTSTQTMSAKTLTGPTINGYTEGVTAVGTVTSSSILSLASGTVLTATLTASTACTFTMPTAVAGQSFILLLKQATTTGLGTATFTSVKWNSAGAPTITPTAAKMDILSFFSDGTDWYGSYTQGFTP